MRNRLTPVIDTPRAERKRAAAKAWREKNKERARAKVREWSAKNKDRKDSQNKAWRERNREYLNEKSKRAYHANKDARKEYNLRRNYGISKQQREDMETEQGGVCAICKKPPPVRTLMVDHCHKTGTVRGLLCVNCNSVIGYAKDSINTLQAAIEYLGAPL